MIAKYLFRVPDQKIRIKAEDGKEYEVTISELRNAVSVMELINSKEPPHSAP
jgi:hypothetical protein